MIKKVFINCGLGLIESHVVTSEKLITYVKDYSGHDLRKAIDTSEINKDLGSSPTATIKQGISKTTDGSFNNEQWLNNVISDNHQNYSKTNITKL